MEGPRKTGSGAANSVSNTTNSNTNMDGKSFQMPSGSPYDDEVSSLDTSHLGGNSLEVSMSAVLFTSAPSFDGNDSTSEGEDRDSAASTGDVGAAIPGVGIAPYEPSQRAASGSGGHGIDDEEDETRKKKGGGDGVLCIPAWIVNAGPCIKAIIVLSTALLVGSLVLVLVAVLISTQNNSRPAISSSAQGPVFSETTSAPTVLPPPIPLPPLTKEPTSPQPFVVEAPLPTLSPVAVTLETPTESPEIIVNGVVSTELPTFSGTLAPSSLLPSTSPTLSPTVRLTTLTPSLPPTMPPTEIKSPSSRPTISSPPSLPPPTAAPSSTPTVSRAPSTSPTATPVPSSDPTISHSPFSPPTVSPHPTTAPSASPVPSDNPTLAPAVPTLTPTVSRHPSSTPTISVPPSPRPTLSPAPSWKPTSSPHPSFSPTNSPPPSSRPTRSPQPTPAPTISIPPTHSPTTRLPTPLPTTSQPTPAPSVSLLPSQLPTSKATTPSPTVPPSDSPLNPPTVAPSLPPTALPTPTVTVEASPPPATTTFYVTGGRFREDSGLSDLLRSLEGDDGLFLVHLGDYNNPFLTGCDRTSVMNVSDLFSVTPVPVFFIPGNNDWIDCFDADAAGAYWREILVGYETKFWKPSTLYTVRRQEKRPENFAFVLRKILHIGLNLVNGFVRDGDEWNARLTDNAEWMEENVELALGEITMIVVYAHSGTEQPTRNAVFFDEFETKVVEWGLPVYVISSTSKEATNLAGNGLGLNNVRSLRVAGRTWPPVKVVIDSNTADFEFNQDDWYDLFISGS